MLNMRILVSVALLIAYFFESELKSAFQNAIAGKKKVDWVIGILSSPENFERRAIIRQTWLSYLDELNGKLSVRPYFIIGKRSCNLTASIRSNDYSCDEVKLGESVKRFSFLVNKLVKSNPQRNTYIYRGFMFEVNHDITVNRLGVLSSALNGLDQFKLLLVHLSKDEIIAKVSQKVNESSPPVDYVYFNLERPVKLKKGFVGQLWLADEMKSRKPLKTLQSVRNDDLNLIKIINVIDDSFTSLRRTTNNVLIATSFDYTLTNRTEAEIKLGSLKADNESMVQNAERIRAQLVAESSAHNDIKLLDNAVDTYRNLPDKLLRFLQYVDSRYSFKHFIKADDDSFLNIPKIFKSIRLDGDKLWFGNFRRNWQVNEFGKWSEPNYQAVAYPPFPCGSAYMLSADLIGWLSTNSKSLFRFQGEDVSMGIWLAAILPTYEHDARWSCQKNAFPEDDDDYFSQGQLSTEEQVGIFKRRKY